MPPPSRWKFRSPSVSQALRYAEDQLGFKLFRRLKGKLSPTLETSVLYPEIDRVFERVSVVNELAYELRRSASGQISVATIPTLSASLFVRRCHFGALIIPMRGHAWKFYPPQKCFALCLAIWWILASFTLMPATMIFRLTRSSRPRCIARCRRATSSHA